MEEVMEGGMGVAMAADTVAVGMAEGAGMVAAGMAEAGTVAAFASRTSIIAASMVATISPTIPIIITAVG